MFKKKKEQKKESKIKKLEASDELQKELSELHKFKWSNILWPIFSIFFIFGILFYIYQAYIIKNTNTILDRKAPEEKIQNKPDAAPEEIKAEEEKKEEEALVEEQKPAAEPEAQYINYTVVEGDTLGAIATANGLTIEEVMKVNIGLVAENLQIGQIIKIPKK